MRDLCITADDFGLSTSVNEGILELARTGAVSAVSVMAHAEAKLDRLPDLVSTGVAVGAHLVLVEERALSGSAQLRSLLDSTGRLPHSYAALFCQLAQRPWLAGALLHEAGAQVQRLETAGVRIAFINSHQHVHLFPPIWRALGPFVIGLRVPVRMAPSWTWCVPGRGAHQTALDAASALSFALGPRPAHGLLRPIGADRAGDMTTVRVAATLAWADAGPQVLRELVAHPGFEDAALHASGLSTSLKLSLPSLDPRDSPAFCH